MHSRVSVSRSIPMRFFSRFGATLHFVCKTHTRFEKKRAARFEEKWSRRERGNARTGRRKASRVPGRCHHLRGFFFGDGGGSPRKKGATRFCAGCVKLNAKKNCFGTKNEDDDEKDDDERKERKSKRET